MIIKDLLKFAYNSFSFAFIQDINPRDLYLSTEDGFLIPPNALIDQAIEVN